LPSAVGLGLAPESGLALVPASVRVPALELVLAWELVLGLELEPVLGLALVRSQWQSNCQVIPPQR